MEPSVCFASGNRTITEGPVDTGHCAMSRDPRATFHVDFNRATEKDARTARRATPKPVRSRRLTIGTIGYTAFSAHDLLSLATDQELARPGHIHG